MRLAVFESNLRNIKKFKNIFLVWPHFEPFGESPFRKTRRNIVNFAFLYILCFGLFGTVFRPVVQMEIYEWLLSSHAPLAAPVRLSWFRRAFLRSHVRSGKDIALCEDNFKFYIIIAAFCHGGIQKGEWNHSWKLTKIWKCV